MELIAPSIPSTILPLVEVIEADRFWVNEANTVASRRKGDLPNPEGTWYEVDFEGYQVVLEQIQERCRQNEAIYYARKKQEKVEKLVEAGIAREVAEILVDA